MTKGILTGKTLLLAFSILCSQMVLVSSKTTAEGDSTSMILQDRHTQQVEPPATTNKRKNSEIRQYKVLESKDIHQRLLGWADKYPNLVRVTTAQKEYGLGAAGTSNDCPFDNGVNGCLNYIVVIQDFVAHPEGSKSSRHLPEVLWSGAVHGDERAGPTSVVEAAQVLLEAATCEALPRIEFQDTDKWDAEVSNARACRKSFENTGINDSGLEWLARLVTTRRIVVVPTANALGYSKKDRTEAGLDPNRDFPYDVLNAKDCMQTIAGRTLNELFRDHLFQSALTFHGGIELIGYEWGATSWSKSPPSPDDLAQDRIAAAYSKFGGAFQGSKQYKYGRMNDIIYWVRGGMEDWAYAGSWDDQRMIQCKPNTFGGYPAEKTRYDKGTLRAFNMLIESNDSKTPPKNALGTSKELLKKNGKGSGYISRNIRLSLLAAELLEPYVTIRKVNQVKLSDDVVPLTPRGNRSCQKTKAVSVPKGSKKVTVEWTVGGSFTVDETQIWYAKWSDIPTNKLDCLSQPDVKDIKSHMKQGKVKGQTTGTAEFSNKGATKFSATLDLSGFGGKNTKIAVLASARVDQSWADGSTGRIKPQPNVPPQSHIVNARTNPSWKYTSANGKSVVQGRKDWFSIPLTIVIKGEGSGNTVELSDRFAGAGSSSAGAAGLDNNNNNNNCIQKFSKGCNDDGERCCDDAMVCIKNKCKRCIKENSNRKCKKDEHCCSGMTCQNKRCVTPQR